MVLKLCLTVYTCDDWTINLSTNATSLLEQGGMMSMTEILVTIFCGYAFAGIVEVSGCLDVMLKRFLKVYIQLEHLF